jgi:hypothetical protein
MASAKRERERDPRSRLAAELTTTTLVDGEKTQMVSLSPSNVAACSPAPSLEPSPTLAPAKAPKAPPPSPLNDAAHDAAPPLKLPPWLCEELPPGSFSDS